MSVTSIYQITMKKKKSTKSSSNVYFLKKSHCPNQIGLGGTINFPLPKTKNKKTIKKIIIIF